MSKKKNMYRLWPNIYDIQSAKEAMMQGIIAVGFLTFLTAIFTTATIIGYEIPKGFGIDAMLNAIIFVFIGWGIHKKSRVATFSGFGLYVVERIYMLTIYGFRNPIIAFLITLMFFNSIRGAIAYHNYRKSKIITRNVIILNSLALLYSIVVTVPFTIRIFVMNPMDILSIEGNLVYTLTGFLAITTYILTVARLMPFTKNKLMVEFSLSENSAISESIDEEQLTETMLDKS